MVGGALQQVNHVYSGSWAVLVAAFASGSAGATAVGLVWFGLVWFELGLGHEAQAQK